MLQFHTLTDTQSASNIIADRLRKELDHGHKVLWLLSGGSNIGIEVDALKKLPLELQKNLTITLNDERFGPFGHKDSNLQQLTDGGLLKTAAKIIPVLVPESLPLTATATHFGDNLSMEIALADTVVSQLGMGSDGHIAGILPNTPAVNATELVCSYTTDLYDRITITAETLKLVNVVYLFAFGPDKRAQLELLRDKKLTPNEQPAQFLKQISEVYVYNDQLDTEVAISKGGTE